MTDSMRLAPLLVFLVLPIGIRLGNLRKYINAKCIYHEKWFFAVLNDEALKPRTLKK